MESSLGRARFPALDACYMYSGALNTDWFHFAVCVGYDWKRDYFESG